MIRPSPMLRKIEISPVNVEHPISLPSTTDPCRVDLREPIIVGSGKICLGELPLRIKEGQVTFQNDEMNLTVHIPPIPPREAGTMPLKIRYEYIQRVLIPPPIDFRGATVLIFSISQLYWHELYSDMRKHIPRLPQEMPVGLQMDLNWYNETEKICKLLRHMAVGRLLNLHDMDQGFFGRRELCHSGYVAFIPKEEIVNILGLTKTKLIPCHDDRGYYYLQVKLDRELRKKYIPRQELEVVDENLEEKLIPAMSSKKSLMEMNFTAKVGNFTLEFTGKTLHQYWTSDVFWMSNFQLEFFIRYYHEQLDENQRKKVTILPSTFCQTFFNDEMLDKDYKEIKKTIREKYNGYDEDGRGFSLFLADYVIIPVTENKHHFLIVIVNPSGAARTIHNFEGDEKRIPSTKVIIFDSLFSIVNDRYPPNHLKILNIVRCFLEVGYYQNTVIAPGFYSTNTIEFYGINCPRQENTNDCGFFAVRFAQKLIQLLPPVDRIPNNFFDGFSISNIRREFARILINSCDDPALGRVISSFGINRY